MMIQQGRQNRKICAQRICRLTKPVDVTDSGTNVVSELLMGTMVSGSGVYGQREEAGTEAKYSHQIEWVVRGGKNQDNGS